MPDLIHGQDVYDIIGCAFEVYNEMGSGFLEAVYQECMEIELTDRQILFEPQKQLQLKYKDHVLQKEYIPDLVIRNRIIVELKAEDKLLPKHEAQLINYLEATKLKVGVLINFGAHPMLEWKRLVN
ncbi:MAG: GxxExxY protein [Opitutaceae bacterium]